MLRSETYPIYDHTARRETFTFFAPVKDKVTGKEKHSKHWLTVNHSGHDQKILITFGADKLEFAGKPLGDVSVFPVTIVN